jgi:hypothetical protein
MSPSPNSADPADSKGTRSTQILLALIAVAGTVLVGYWQYGRTKADSPPVRHQLTGRVLDAVSNHALAHAKVILESEDVPPVEYTDSEGIFTFPLPPSAPHVRLKVELSGYEPADRRIDPSTLQEAQEVRLQPLAAAPPLPPKVTPVDPAAPTTVTDRSTSSFTVEPPSQSPEREPAKPAAPEILRQRVFDHIFELKQCSLTGISLECEVLITNQGEDRTLRLSPASARLVDEGGTEYSCVSLTLGGGGSHVPTMTFGDNKPPAGAKLTTGVPVKAVLTFEGIPSGTKRAALIEIQETAGGFYGGRGLKAQFRNVPLGQH